MALPSRNPADRPEVNPLSPATAYVTKDNIVLPVEAQRQGVAVLADARIEDTLPQQAASATHATVASLPTPPSE